MLLNAIQSFLTYCEISLFFITRKFVFFYICCAVFQDLLLPLVYGTVLSFFFFLFFFCFIALPLLSCLLFLFHYLFIFLLLHFFIF